MDQVTAILDRLLALHPQEIDLSLDRMERLLAALGHPEKEIPPVIHVAGTNGKGSTLAAMRAILEAAGHKVHVYTSPHLVAFNERIRLAGEIVDDARLIAALEECERVNGGQEITFFEITTAAAFLLFSQVQADILLLEVGLGGRLDATNVIEPPLACIITPLSMDHERYLGASLSEIAYEKAGIIKAGVPVVTSAQDEAASTVISSIAARHQAPMHVFGQDFMTFEEHGRLVYQDDDGLLDLPLPRLAGHHQAINTGLALAALRVARLLPDVPTIEKGLGRIDWPARLQPLSQGPILELCPKGAEVWLDGGHNPGAGLVVAAFMGEQEERSPRPLYLVTGMLKTKDPVGFFLPFHGLARHVATVPITVSNAGRDPFELADAARAAGLEATPFDTLDAAFADIRACVVKDGEPPRILICGSLYLAGEVLALNRMAPV